MKEAANQVRVLTRQPVTADELTDEGPGSYREIYEEVRDRAGGESLRRFIARIGSTASPSYWSQYEAGEKRLNWQRKMELRRYVGLPDIPRPVLEVVDESVDLDATVWAVGADAAAGRRCGPGHSARPRPGRADYAAHQRQYRDCRAAGARRGPAGTRPLRRHVSISVELAEELDAVREAEGLTWEQLLGRPVKQRALWFAGCAAWVAENTNRPAVTCPTGHNLGRFRRSG